MERGRSEVVAHRVLEIVDRMLIGTDKFLDWERALSHIALLIEQAVVDELDIYVREIVDLKRELSALDVDYTRLKTQSGLDAVDIVMSIVVNRRGTTFDDHSTGLKCSFGPVPDDKGPITLFVIVPKKGGSDYERLERASVALMEAAQKARNEEANDGG